MYIPLSTKLLCKDTGRTGYHNMRQIAYIIFAILFAYIALQCGYATEWLGFNMVGRIVDYYVSDMLLVPAFGCILFILPNVFFEDEDVLRVSWWICHIIAFTIAMITEFSSDPTWCYNSIPGDPIDIAMYIIGLTTALWPTKTVGRILEWDDRW